MINYGKTVTYLESLKGRFTEVSFISVNPRSAGPTTNACPVLDVQMVSVETQATLKSSKTVHVSMMKCAR